MEINLNIFCKRPGEQNTSSPKKLKPLPPDEEESNFFLVFENIINILKERMKIPDAEIALGVESIIQSFKWKEGNHFSDVDLNRLGNLCGYLYRYAPHGAGLARTRIMDAISNCEDMKSKLKKPELNIVSLGGGPGNDIVGLCSALYDFECRSVLNITVTDSVQRFSSCLNLLEFLIREEDYGNVSKLFKEGTVNMSFMRLILPDCKGKKCLQTLREADIIVMSKVFSILGQIRCERLIKTLDEEVNPGCIILFIDSPFYPDLWREFDILYLSNCTEYAKSKATHKFGSSDRCSSKAQIVVLRKRFFFIRSC